MFFKLAQIGGGEAEWMKRGTISGPHNLIKSDWLRFYFVLDLKYVLFATRLKVGVMSNIMALPT